jgi:hypothetical protein
MNANYLLIFLDLKAPLLLVPLSQLNKVCMVLMFNLNTRKNIILEYRYIPTRKNLNRWGISSNSKCTFNLSPESLLHVVDGCQSYLECFTCRHHNSILNSLAQTLQSVNGYNLFASGPYIL